MLRLSVQLNEIYLNLKLKQQESDPNNTQNICIKFYFTQKNDRFLLKPKVPFTSNLEDLSLHRIKHQIYIKKSDVQKEKLNYRILLCKSQSNQQKGQKDLQLKKKEEKKRISKYVGECQIVLKNLLMEGVYPLKMDLKVPIKNCLAMVINEVEEFSSLFDKKQRPQKTLQQQNQTDTNPHPALSLAQSQLSSLQSRSTRFLQQIAHLKQQNSQLRQQTKDRHEAIEMGKKLEEDKLDLLIRKNVKAEKEFRKVKEDLSDIVNLVNQYGGLDVGERLMGVLQGEV